ncbi:metal-dependent hydrolase family protein [Nitriliruptor alkaliphilus]|uniref:metal-dependent hydrolase family protein n=1 Tax=Nitriliruptor alkaliphilus TaxID=427918 RepID=UPI000A903E48|nr:amidohydrolase family protein [Nitriliruptor alkaliphilus]
MAIRIEATRLLPGRGQSVEEAVLVLDGGTISYAGSRVDAPATDGATRVQVDTVMPGLWDCHVHLLGALGADPTSVTREPLALRGARTTIDLVAALEAGVTSVREAGGLGIHVARAVAEGTIPGPRIYAAGAWLSVTGGHGDLAELPLSWIHQLAVTEPSTRLCDGVDDCITAVREQLREGAEVIKICASGGVMSSRNDPRHQHFTRAELAAIVEVAGLAGRSVMAHCHGTGAMLAAIEAGVRTIEHGTYLDEEVCAAMVERDVLLVPTRLVVREMLAPDPSNDISPEMRAKLVEIDHVHADAMGRAHAAGVRIAMGTDVMVTGRGKPVAWGNHGRELPLMVEFGMSPLEAIESATANGPDTLGERAPLSGQLVAGYDADVIAVAGDPLADVSVLADPGNVTHVWQAGELTHDLASA